MCFPAHRKLVNRKHLGLEPQSRFGDILLGIGVAEKLPGIRVEEKLLGIRVGENYLELEWGKNT